MQVEDITQDDINLLKQLRASGGLPNYFWQVPLVRYLLMWFGAIVSSLVFHAYFDAGWSIYFMSGVVVFDFGRHIGSTATTRLYKPLLLKMLDRDLDLRQRL